MLIAYMSLTGNVRDFVERLGFETIEINHSNPLINTEKDYIIVTPTYDVDITEPINEFIEYKSNIKHLKGIVGSGNYNFDDLYIFTAKNLSDKYNVPLIYGFELLGTDRDVTNLKEELGKFAIT